MVKEQSILVIWGQFCEKDCLKKSEGDESEYAELDEELLAML